MKDPKHRFWRARRFWAVALTLAVVTLLGALLRLYRLGELPPGLFFDEAGQALDVYDLLAGRRLLFFERSSGKEPLFIYWSAPFVMGLDPGPWAVRLPAALAGIVAIPAVFFLIRELTIVEFERHADLLALFAAGLLACSYWAVSVNRLAFRANLLPLTMALAFGLLWHAWRRGGLTWAIAGGAMLGLSFYTYIAARMVLPLALLFLLMATLTEHGRGRWSARRREIAAAAVVAVAVMLPLALHFALQPEDFFRRAAIIGGGSTSLSSVTSLPAKLAASLTMFGGAGDPLLRHNVPGRSILTPWLAALFWLGVGLAIVRAQRPNRLAALAWLGVMLLPAALAGEEPRHFLRTFGALPIAFYFPALAVGDLWTWSEERFGHTHVARRRAGSLLAGALAGLILVEFVLTGQAYFGRWAHLPNLDRAFRTVDSEMAAAINAMPERVRAIVPLAPLWQGLSDSNYTLDYLIDRPQDTLIFLPDAPTASEQLAAFLARPGAEAVHIFRYEWGQDAEADPRNLTGLFVDQVGHFAGREVLGAYSVERFQVDASPAVLGRVPPSQPLTATLSNGEVTLDLFAWQAYPHPGLDERAHLPSGGNGMIALDWQLDGEPSSSLRVSLRLLDSIGEPVGQVDSLLADRESTDMQRTHHPLTAAPGTPPGRYRLQAIVYASGDGGRLATRAADGAPREAVELGAVRVGKPLPDAELYAPDFVWTEARPLNRGRSLRGASFPAYPLAPGLPLDLILAWSVDREAVDDQIVFSLGDVLAGSESLRLPRRGPWRTAHRLRIPADLASGAHGLRLRVGGEDWIELGQVVVEPLGMSEAAVIAQFADGIRLVGWDADSDGNRLTVTLFWQHETTAEQPTHGVPDYTAFVHLVDASGNLIAQHDSQPGDGRYPTSVWPSDVTVPDTHSLTLPDGQQADALRLRVGLYLPGSGLRLSLADGSDFVELASGSP